MRRRSGVRVASASTDDQRQPALVLEALPAPRLEDLDATFTLSTDVARFYLYDPTVHRSGVGELDDDALAGAMKRGAVCGFDTGSDGVYRVRIRGAKKAAERPGEPMIVVAKARLRLDNASGGARTLLVPAGTYRVDVGTDAHGYVVSLSALRAKPKRVASRMPLVERPVARRSEGRVGETRVRSREGRPGSEPA